MTEAREDAPRVTPEPTVADWHARLDAHAEEHGFHARLSPRHGALFTEEDEYLLVTFENAAEIRRGGGALPFGLLVAGREGWSHLCLYSEGDTWFRDEEVYAFFDDLVDDGFFDHFDGTLFYGVGPGGYAAAAFSVVAPGARVLAVRPQATLDPRIAGWDDRHKTARRADFTSRYGYGPEMIEGAEQGILLYDPFERLDGMHAALYTKPNVTHLRARYLGPAPEEHLDAMNILVPMVRAAGKGRLDKKLFAELFRKRQRHPPYLRNVLDRLEAEQRPGLAARWCRAVLRFSSRARFQTGLARALKALHAQGKSLPPERDDPDA